MTNSLITIKNLGLVFQKEHQTIPALLGVNFSIASGETYALLGESGSGKSLTSLSIMQLIPPQAHFVTGSEIWLQDTDLLQIPEIELQKIRGRRIAMIFQEPMTSLNPVMTVGDQIREVLHKHFALNGKAAQQRVLDLLHEVGLPDPMLTSQEYPHQLSGGMKQRVMIAIALAGEPGLLIADEPTSALDVTIQAQILSLLKNLQEKLQMAMLFITHDLAVVRQIADRVGVMYDGHIVEEASKADFYNDPKHPYTKKLFASMPSLQKRKQKLAVIPGQIPPIKQVLNQCRFVTRCPFAWQTCRDVVPKWLLSESKHGVRCHLYDHSLPKEQQSPQQVKLDSETIPTERKRELQIKSEIETSRFHEKDNVTPSLDDSFSEEVILHIKDLKIHFPIQKGLFKRTVGWVKAVDGVNLTLEVGKTLALVGESGCGKTTLAKGLLHLEPATSGEMRIDGIDVMHLRRRDLRRFRQYVQIIFQDPFSSMNPRMLVGDIIAEGMHALRIGKNNKQRRARVEELITQVGLPENSYHRYPHEFSGGQRQRICIARALAVNPKLIICDEPTSALDVSVQAQILNLLKELQQQHQLSYLFITHNMAVVAYLADYVAVMKQGRIVERGDIESVLKNPYHSYTKELLKAVPIW